MRLRATFVAACALAILVPGAAAAQTKDELNRARGLFREGVALEAAKDWSGALAKYKEVAELKKTPQVAFAIAECEEHTGKLVSALGNYRLAQSMAQGDKKAEKDVAAAGDRIAALEPKVPTLTVKRGKNADNATLTLDDQTLGGSQIGSPMPVDPGPHSIVAKVGDQEVGRASVNLSEGDKKELAIDAKDAAPPPPPPPTTTATTAPTDAPPDEKPRSKVPEVVLIAGGGVSVVVGVIFLGLRGGALSDLEAKCPGRVNCSSDAQSSYNSGKTDTGVAEVTIGLGVIAAATGAILLATSGPSKAAAAPASDNATTSFLHSVRLVPSAPGSNIGGASLLGRF